jgi:hypothetical protein
MKLLIVNKNYNLSFTEISYNPRIYLSSVMEKPLRFKSAMFNLLKPSGNFTYHQV